MNSLHLTCICSLICKAWGAQGSRRRCGYNNACHLHLTDLAPHQMLCVLLLLIFYALQGISTDIACAHIGTSLTWAV